MFRLLDLEKSTAAKNRRSPRMAKATKNKSGNKAVTKAAKATKATPKGKVATKAPKAPVTPRIAANAIPKANGKFTNPFRPGSNYWTLTEILAKKIGKFTAVEEIIKAVPAVMGAEAWKAFKSREKRNDNGKDFSGRLIQNLDVIRRPDYGSKIIAQGYAVQKKWDGDVQSFGLVKGK